MVSLGEQEAGSGPGMALGRGLRVSWGLFAVAATVALAVILRAFYSLPGDVSWLLTLDEKMLDGARPYVDFLEINPPASLCLYVPAVAAARFLGLRPETLVGLGVFACVLASFVLAAALLLKAGLLRAASAGWHLAAASLVYLVVPTTMFAQREHFAVVLVLPVLAAYAARRTGVAPPRPLSILAGVAAGAAISIKPHFALALALPLLDAMLACRLAAAPRLRPLAWPENLAAGATFTAYCAWAVLAFPAFFTQVMPLARDLYIPTSLPLIAALLQPGIILTVLALALFHLLRPGWRHEPPGRICVLAAVGFALATIIQAKPWAYQSFPAASLMLLACASALVERWRDAAARRGLPLLAWTSAFVLVLGLAFEHYASDRQYPTLVEAARAVLPPKPKMALIGFSLGLGHPTVRQLQGEWVDPMPSRWITRFVEIALDEPGVTAERKQALEAWADFDRAALVAAIRERKPDVVLMEDDSWRAWAAAHADVASALAGYREVPLIGGVSARIRP